MTWQVTRLLSTQVVQNFWLVSHLSTDPMQKQTYSLASRNGRFATGMMDIRSRFQRPQDISSNNQAMLCDTLRL